MSVLRPVLICVLLLVLLLSAALVSPVVQTWWVNRALAQRGVQATVGSFWALPGHIEVSDARWERDGITFTAAQINAEVPVAAALRRGEWRISRLVVKNWTIDTTAHPKTDASTASNSSPSPTLRRPSGAAPAWRLPEGVAIEHAELEGDATVAVPWSAKPVHFHAVIIGGPIQPGGMAELSLDAAGTFGGAASTTNTGVAQGKLHVPLASDGAPERLEFSGRIASPERALPQDLAVAVAANFTGGDTHYELQLRRGDRAPVTADVTYDAASRRFRGAWTADLRPEEIKVIVAEGFGPLSAMTGSGRFEADAALASIRATGTARGRLTHLKDASPALARVDDVGYAVEFDAISSHDSVRIESLRARIGDAQPVLEILALQPFAFDPKTSTLTPAHATAECATITARGVPVAWLPVVAGRWSLSSSTLAGEVSVTADQGTVALHTVRPLLAHAATLTDGDLVVARNIDLNAPVTATYAHDAGWVVKLSDATVRAGDRPLAKANLTIHPLHDPYRTAEAHGTIEVDLDAVRANTALRPPAGRMATWDGELHSGPAADANGTVRIQGHRPDLSASLTVNANIEDYRAVTFRTGLTLTDAAKSSTFSIEGTWANSGGRKHVDVEVGGDTVDADALRRVVLAGPLAPLASAFAPSMAPSRSDIRMAGPFWGDIVGRLRFALRHVTQGEKTFDNVEANFAFAPDRLELNGGHAAYNPIDLSKHTRKKEDLDLTLEPISAYTLEGSLAWDATAAAPYRLTMHGAVDAIDGARLFGYAAGNQPPQLEGRWSASANISSTGSTLGELRDQRAETYRFESTAGAMRLLGASIGDALPDAATPVSDAAANVGSAVTWLFGVKRDALNRENHLSKGTEAVLNFSYAIRELPYDKVTIDAMRRADGSIALTKIEITAPKVRLTGSGTMATLPKPVADWPFDVALTLTVQGSYADQLGRTTLLKGPKDHDGWATFVEPVRLRGTLNAPDKTLWHDQLARAAVAAEKK